MRGSEARTGVLRRRAALIVNPAAGQRFRGSPIAELAAALTAGGWQVDAQATRQAGHATALAREAVADGCEAVFACGGDGTLREVAAALLGTPVALGVLPGGTTNVVARALGLPRRPLAAARLLARGVPVQVDVGRCGDEVFLMLASAGLDARVLAASAGTRLKRLFGRAGIASSALAEWLRARSPMIELLADGEPLAAAGVFICNLPLYAGSLRLAPQARWDDGALELVLLGSGRRRAALGFALALVRGRHLARRDVAVRRVREVTLLGPPGARLQVDGDVLAATPPVNISLATTRLLVLSPDRSDR